MATASPSDGDRKKLHRKDAASRHFSVIFHGYHEVSGSAHSGSCRGVRGPLGPDRWPIWNGYREFNWRVDGGDLPAHLQPYVKNPAVWFSPEDRLSKRGPTSFAVNAELAPGWPLSKIGRPAEAIYLTDRTDLDVLTIGPSQESPEVYYWWKFCNPPLDRGPADLPHPYDDLMVAVQISPRRYVGDVAAFLFLDGHVNTLPFAKTWGDASTNLHYPFK